MMKRHPRGIFPEMEDQLRYSTYLNIKDYEAGRRFGGLSGNCFRLTKDRHKRTNVPLGSAQPALNT